MSKNIQIPVAMFLDVVRLLYALDDYELDKSTTTLVKHLEGQINVKLETIEKRKTFTEYKTTPIGKEREEKRKKYLKIIGCCDDWISDQELPY